MDKLLDQLLDISATEADDLILRPENHNVSELVRKMAVEYIMVLDGDQIELDPIWHRRAISGHPADSGR
jgi:hypothetical protein